MLALIWMSAKCANDNVQASLELRKESCDNVRTSKASYGDYLQLANKYSYPVEAARFQNRK